MYVLPISIAYTYIYTEGPYVSRKVDGPIHYDIAGGPGIRCRIIYIKEAQEHVSAYSMCLGTRSENVLCAW